ncbi:biotin--[acetyl-CoA-carboxylase] ligase [Persicobacter psychrovividus]|uniref:Biotin--[acetyl-CoA-carboxylase] ligase n=2 Tax=Persicobacter psychrovividus TaxID=387638 RepID=A0ABM7VAX2_9BACT|nr:biotin--[acetyl-CoA-carboxylase] ligase [Persicobacter psychrovividus]
MNFALKGDINNGTVIVAEDQTAGRGQRGNHWESEPGKNLTFSAAVQLPFVHLSEQFYISMVVALSIYEVLEQYIPSDLLKLKWPNDILVGEQKICGILIENVIRAGKIDWCVIGVGLNVNQMSFQLDRAISLGMCCGQLFDKREILQLIVQSMSERFHNLAEGHQEKIKEAYLNALYGYQQVHDFEEADGTRIKGRIIGVEDQGPLLVESALGQKSYQFKEIKFVALDY